MPSMKAFVTTGSKTATVQNLPIPTPNPGEILIQVTYAAQNPTDYKSVLSAPADRISGCDFAGTVADPNGSSWRPGQRVAGWVFGCSEDPVRGSYAQYLVTEARLVFAVPDEVSDQQAAVTGLAFATAVQAMFARLQLPEPSKPATAPFPFLVFGASGGVGKYAVQLAKLAGLYVVGTASKRNHEDLKAVGADAVFDYRDEDWPEQVRELTHGKLERAFDCISEKGSTQAIARAMSPTKGGHVVCLLPIRHLQESGEIENKKVRLESTIVYTMLRSLEGTYHQTRPFDNTGAKETTGDKALLEKYLSMMPELLTSGKIKPHKYRELGGLDEIQRGFTEQQEGKVNSEKLVYKIA